MTYFIKDEENLDLLDDNGFVSLIDEIQHFYEKRNDLESLLDFNYKMKVYFDVTTERQKVVILETKSDESEQNQSMQEMSFMSRKTDDENFSKNYDDNGFKETLKLEVLTFI